MMEEYIRLLDAYKLTSRYKVLAKVFRDDPANKKLLYSYWILVFLFLLVSAIDINSYFIVCAIVPAILGAFRYVGDLYRTYDSLFTSSSVRSFVKEYGVDYQGLRYLIFKQVLGVFTEPEIFSARQYLKIKKENKKVSNFKNHWFLLGLFGVLAAVSGNIINGFSKETLYVALFLILIVISYSTMLIQLYVSPEDRDAEFSLFLAWLEKDLPVQGDGVLDPY
jgi:hypothetical protein